MVTEQHAAGALDGSVDPEELTTLLAQENQALLVTLAQLKAENSALKATQPAAGEPIGKVELFGINMTYVEWRDRKMPPLGTELYAAPPAAAHGDDFQARVQPWMLECFGEMIAGDREERNHRFLEEALELVQSTGCTASEAHQLVDYVFGRPVGEPAQEVGGVMVTLAALCLANSLDMHDAAEVELARIWTKVEAIRAKQAAKPKHSPLPIAAAHGDEAVLWELLEALRTATDRQALSGEFIRVMWEAGCDWINARAAMRAQGDGEVQ